MALSRKTRRFIVGGLVILFLIVAPLLVLYARGYRYSFQRQVLKKVGMIMLAYEPVSARATVNDQGAPFDLTALGYDRFPDLETGTYHVQVSADNYHTWRKNLEVAPEFVTWARYIILFKKDTKPRNIISQPQITTVSISPDKLWLATATAGSDGPQITMIPTTADKSPSRINLRDSDNSLPQTARINKISFAPDSTNILLAASNGEDNEFYLVISRENNNNFKPIVLNDYIPNLKEAVWHPSAATIIYARTQPQELYRLSLTGPITSKKLASQVLGFTPAPDGLYFFRPAVTNDKQSERQASLMKMALDGSNTKTISSDFELTAAYKIMISEKLKVAVLTDTAYLYVHLPETSKTERVAKGITEAIWSQDTDKEDSTDEILLYFNPHEIYIFDPLIFNSDTITRYTENITNVDWYTGNYKYIVFTTANKLKIMELDERDRRNVFDLWETDSNTIIAPQALFSDKDNKHIYLHLREPETHTVTDLTIR